MTRTDNEPAFISKACYRTVQIEMICDRTHKRNALSTKLAFEAGLRPMELGSIYRVEDDFFVIGKAELHREITISKELKAKLMEVERENPVELIDRGEVIISHFDLAYGQTWSQWFSKASKRVLGWTEGARGLRHAWAYTRYDKLRKHFSYKTAINIVHFEMGKVGTELNKPKHESIEEILNEIEIYDVEKAFLEIRTKMVKSKTCYEERLLRQKETLKLTKEKKEKESLRAIIKENKKNRVKEERAEKRELKLVEMEEIINKANEKSKKLLLSKTPFPWD